MLFIVLFVVGLSGYAVFAGLGIRYVFAHVAGLGILGLLGYWAASIAKKKGHGYPRALFLGFVLPVALGVISVGVVYASGGHGCGGIVSLVAAFVVILYYAVARKRGDSLKACRLQEPKDEKVG